MTAALSDGKLLQQLLIVRNGDFSIGGLYSVLRRANPFEIEIVFLVVRLGDPVPFTIGLPNVIKENKSIIILRKGNGCAISPPLHGSVIQDLQIGPFPPPRRHIPMLANETEVPISRRSSYLFEGITFRFNE